MVYNDDIKKLTNNNEPEYFLLNRSVHDVIVTRSQLPVRQRFLDGGPPSSGEKIVLRRRELGELPLQVAFLLRPLVFEHEQVVVEKVAVPALL